MEDIRFDGQVAIITGAGRGLGFSHAKLLGERGAKIVINDVSGAEEAAAQLKELGIEAVADSHDISKMESAQAIVDLAIEKFGRLDILVNNAGICRNYSIEDESYEDFDFVMKVNVYGSRNLCKAAFPIMKEQGYGRIINTSSAAGVYGIGNLHAYSVSKGAVYSMTRSLALAGEALGIKVNALVPTAATPMTLEAGVDEATVAWVKQNLPPEAVSPMVALLASKECPVNGKVFEGCGGRMNEVFMGTAIGMINEEGTPESLLRDWEYVVDKTDYLIIEDGLRASDPLALAFQKHAERKAQA